MVIQIVSMIFQKYHHHFDVFEEFYPFHFDLYIHVMMLEQFLKQTINSNRFHINADRKILTSFEILGDDGRFLLRISIFEPSFC